MSNNNIPAIITGISSAALVLQAFIVPSAAIAANDVSASRRVSTSTTADGQTEIRVTLSASAHNAASAFTVYDHFMSTDLEQQGFALVMTGDQAPQSLDQMGAQAVQPIISDDGKTLGFSLDALNAGGVAGITYVLRSPNSAHGDGGQPLTTWAAAKNPDGTLAHFGAIEILSGASSVTSMKAIKNTGDAYSTGSITAHFDTLGGNVLDDITVAKADANALYTQALNTKPTRQGYQFDGWFMDDKLSQPLTVEGIPTGNFTLYAKWVPYTPEPNVPQMSSATDPNGGTTAKKTTTQASGAATKNGAQSGKGDLAPTGESNVAAVIVASVSVVSGLSVLVLRRRIRNL